MGAMNGRKGNHRVTQRDKRSETSDAQSERFKQAARPKPAKLGAEKLSSEEQRRRFIEAAREAGASEDEAELDRALRAIVKPGDGGTSG